LVGPHEHHSNILPWRESCATVLQLPESADGRGVCLHALQSALQSAAAAAAPLRIAALSACSNVTGLAERVMEVAALCHAHGCLVAWDCAAAAHSARLLCANPAPSPQQAAARGWSSKDCAADALFFSPHKLPGGVSAPGVLLIKRSLLLARAAAAAADGRPAPPPAEPGGGTVFFVSDAGHCYVRSAEEAEQSGSRDVAGVARCALALRARAAAGGGAWHALPGATAAVGAALRAQPGIRVLGPATHGVEAPGSELERSWEQDGPTWSLLLRGCAQRWLHPSFLVALLSDLFGIQARAGCACAGPYGLRLLGLSAERASAFERALAGRRGGLGEALRPGWARVSLGYAVSGGDACFLVAALVLLARHGWRLLPLYRFNGVTGEWAHSSRINRFPDRVWLGTLRWPAGEVPPPAEAAAAAGVDETEVAAKRARMLAEAASLLESAAPAAGGGEAGAEEDAEEALRWFCLPEEASAALRTAHPARIVPPALPAPGGEAAWLAAMAAQAAQEPRLPPPLGPVQPRVYEDAEAAAEAGWELASAAVSGHVASWRPADGCGPEYANLAELAAIAFAPSARRAPPPPPASDSSDPGYSSEEAEAEEAQGAAEAAAAPPPPPPGGGGAGRRAAPPRKLLACVARCVAQHDMIRPGERILLGLSGGKDSLSLLHILLHMQARSPVRFTLAVATVDPGADGFDPRPLVPYVRSLGLEHHFLENSIMADAAGGAMEGDSICAFCARMKRGALYRCARERGYTALALGQHADDIVESLLLSAFHNGALRTMKACYAVDGGLRVIRPLAGARERATRDFAYAAGLPVIPDNCPACFSAPKQRARVKQLLRREGRTFPNLFSSLLAASQPLLDARVPPLLRAAGARLEARKKANKGVRGAAEAEAVADPRLADIDSEALAAELVRRGGVALSPAALAKAGEGEDAEEEAEEAAAAARACPLPRRA